MVSCLIVSRQFPDVFLLPGYFGTERSVALISFKNLGFTPNLLIFEVGKARLLQFSKSLELGDLGGCKTQNLDKTYGYTPALHQRGLEGEGIWNTVHQTMALLI